MAFKLRDRVKQTSTTTGTGTLQLNGGAPAGFQDFVDALNSGDTCYYAITDETSGDWETGIGTFTDASPDTLSRDTVLGSSNGGALVSWGVGTRNVFITLPGQTVESLLATGSNGILVQTGNRTYARRSITTSGTRLSVSNGNGVSGNPNIDITEDLGLQRVLGLTGENNASAALYDLNATLGLIVTNGSKESVILGPTGSKTNDLTIAGPTANGRDQSGAFASNDVIYIYFIWDGTDVNTISSKSTPTTGPSLPSGYTHWAFAMSFVLKPSAVEFLANTRVRGNKLHYLSAQSILTGGTATGATAVDISDEVPTNAQSLFVTVDFRLSTGTTGNGTAGTGVGATSGFVSHTIAALTQASTRMGAQACVELPRINNNIYYQNSISAGGTGDLDLYITGYSVPNGDSG